MANPAPTINQINAFNATQGTTIDFNIIGGTELIRSNRIYIYDLSDNSLICTHLYVSTESIHELPPNTDGSIVYESGKSSADFVNGAQYYAQIQTYTDTNGTQGGSGLSVAKMFWCLGDPTLTITTIPSTISTTSYNISATYTDTSASVVSNIIQQYQFNLYSATGSLLQSSGVVVGSGTQQGTSDVYDISHNFTGLNVGSSYYVTVDVTTTQGMSVTTQSNTFTVSIDTPTLGEATVVNNACDGYISVTSNLSGEYGGSGSGEIVSFETDSENVFSKLQVDGLEPVQEGSGDPSPSNVRPIRGHSEVDVNVVGKNLFQTTAESKTENGLTWTVNQDGTITVTGTPTNYTALNVGRAYVNGIDDNVTISQIDPASNVVWGGIEVYDNTNQLLYQVTPGGTDPKFTVNLANYPTAEYIAVAIKRNNNNIAINTTVKIQVELGTTATEWEPYQQPQTTTQDFNATLTPTSTDTTPYLFKAVGDVYGDRLEDKIVGGTVAWNQAVGQTVTTNSITDTATSLRLSLRDMVPPYTVYVYNSNLSTGVYRTLFSAPAGSTGTTLIHNGSTVNFNFWGNSKYNIISGHKYLFSANIKGVDVTTVGGVIIEDVMLIDLTQMFGSTIADYIYSLERSQAGAGVAWFKKLFPKDYYAYNAGELLSVEGLQSHDTVGFNQWDKSNVVQGKYIDNDGSEVPYVTLSHTDYIKVVPNTVYYVSDTQANALVSLFANYDAGKNFLGFSTAVGGDGHLRQTFSNTAYIIVNVLPSAVNTLCINLSNPSRNGEYEPYEKHSYPLDSSLTLRGIPKLDASNNLYYDGDEYTSDGKVKRKYGVVDLGSLTWTYNSTYNVFTASVNYASFPTPGYNNMGVCSKYLVHGSVAVSALANYDDTIFICPYNWSSSTKWLVVRDTSYTDATTFKSAMSGVMLVYELATPTPETAQAYTNPQIVSKYGTIEYVTNSIVPVGHKTTYLTRDIFGGYVDLISGTLVVDRKYVLGDTLDWAYVSSGAYFYAITSDKEKGYNNVTCNIYATAQQAGVANLQNNQIVGDMNDTTVYVKDNRYTNATTFKQAMSGTGILYELATPQTYQLTPQQVNTLVGTNNVWSEQGSLELSYHIPITNLLVKRQDVDDVSGGWLTLYSQPISQASDMDFTFIDFLNQYGKTYKYALVPLLTQTQSGVEVEVEGGYTVSNEVQSVFDGVFIADSTGSQKCKANVGYGNVDMNQVVGSITPIGAKYPIIITNSHNQYHNGSISGTIVPDDYYFNGNLSRIDMVKKRNELEQFLTNKRVKVIKDWNGNIWLVMIVGNVSCTFNNNYGMGIVDFSTNWTEVGDPTNQQDLQATGLINVGGV